jgi:pimeloyl-ACP methyl ester carboxylesterase
VKLHLREWGDAAAPPLVCLHGVTHDGGTFAGLAARLPGFRVLAPDLRGHGRSTWEPPWSLETLLEDVLETVDVAPAPWVGHSLGGRLVLELLAREPGRVERAVLLDPAIRIRPDHALELADAAQLRVADGYSRSAHVAILGELAAWAPPPEGIRVPVLLVRAGHDSVVGPRQLARYERALGGLLEVVTVRGGHEVLADALDETATAVQAFLDAPA